MDEAVVAPLHVASHLEALPLPLLEDCRRLTLELRFDESPTLAVTSTLRGEGRTLIALAIASLLADEHGKQVILVELDLARPRLLDLLRLDPGPPGVADVLSGRAALAEATVSVHRGLRVLTAGRRASDEAALAHRYLRSGFTSTLLQRADIVVGDLPPVGEGASGLALARAFSQSLLVIRKGRAPVARIQEAVNALPSPPAVVLNDYVPDLPAWLRGLVEG